MLASRSAVRFVTLNNTRLNTYTNIQLQVRSVVRHAHTKKRVSRAGPALTTLPPYRTTLSGADFSLDRYVYVQCHAGRRGTHSLSDNNPLRERDDFVGSMDGMPRVATSVLHAFQQNVPAASSYTRPPAVCMESNSVCHFLNPSP